MSFESPKSPLTQSGEVELEVTDRLQESRNVVSIRLKPTGDAAITPFCAGQHLVLKTGAAGRSVSTYTISSAPGDAQGYRISVKLEAAGQGGSRFFHETATPGTRIRATRPRGSFTLAEDARPVILLTGGIGITPAIAMLHVLSAEKSRPVYFIHACNDREEHSFAEEVATLAARHDGIRVFTAYTNGTYADLADHRCDHLGLIDRDVLRKLISLDHYRVYLCGPVPFMDAMRRALRSLGIQDADIQQESFGASIPVAIPADAPKNHQGAGTQVAFARSGLDAEWVAGESLLDLAERNGLTPEFSCRAGICGTCQCGLLSGEIEYDEDPLDPPPAGTILLCCARPKGPVALDL